MTYKKSMRGVCGYVFLAKLKGMSKVKIGYCRNLMETGTF